MTFRHLWKHSLALAVVLSIGFTLIGAHSIAVGDEAVYAVQAEALADGSWSVPRPAVDLDPDGSRAPLIDSTITGDRLVAYDRHRLYPLLLVPGAAVAGYAGALAVSCLGTWLAAVAAGLLAGRIDRRFGVPALWIAGIGSPLLFDAYVLWAHSIVAATAGFAALWVTRALDRDRPRLSMGLALVAAVVTVFLRSEGAVFVLALGAVTLAESLRRSSPYVETRVAALGSALMATSVAARWLDSKWSASGGGSGGYGTSPSRFLLGPDSGPRGAAWSSLFRPASAGAVPGTALVVATVSFAVAALIVRSGRGRAVVPWALVATAAGAWVVVAARSWGADAVLISGLLPAFPVLGGAAAMVKRSDLRIREVVRPIATFVVGSVLLLLMIYERGGATEWGGRFFHVFLVPLVGPVLYVFDRRSVMFDRVERRSLMGLLVVVVLAPSIVGVAWLVQRKEVVRRDVERAVATARQVTRGGDRPVVLVWRSSGDGTSRWFWSRANDVDVLRLGSWAGVLDLLDEDRLERAGNVVLITDLPVDLFGAIMGDDLDGAGWSVDRRESWSDGYVQAIVLQRDGG